MAGFEMRSRYDRVPLDEVFVVVSMREADSRDSDSFEDTCARKLVGNHRGLEAVRYKLIIRF
jgi:hypothetical protein